MWLLEWLPLRWKRAAPESIETGPPPPKQGRWEKVLEDLPSGYPSFSAFLATSNSSQVYRRFTNLRSRVLLAKQDRLSVLEDKLEALGKAEDRPIFLGSCRIDQNQERKQVLLEIDLALSSYDESLKRDFQILHFNNAQNRDINSVRSWISNTGCITRKETEYLQHDDDLFTLSTPIDGTLVHLESWVEDRLIQFFNKFYRSLCKQSSRDENLYIPSNRLSAHIARGILGLTICILLFWPIVLCTFLQSDLVRLAVVISAATLLVVSILAMTSARTIEVVASAAAYAAVLTVFITQGGSTSI